MSKPEVLQTLFDYNASLNQRIRQSTLEVSPEQFVQSDGYLRGPLREQDLLFFVWEAPDQGAKAR